jgi:hypothetical protein
MKEAEEALHLQLALARAVLAELSRFSPDM